MKFALLRALNGVQCLLFSHRIRWLTAILLWMWIITARNNIARCLYWEIIWVIRSANQHGGNCCRAGEGTAAKSKISLCAFSEEEIYILRQRKSGVCRTPRTHSLAHSLHTKVGEVNFEPFYCVGLGVGLKTKPLNATQAGESLQNQQAHSTCNCM